MTAFRRKAAALAVIASIALTACGGDGETADNQSQTGEAAATTITYWSMWQENEPQAAILKQAAEDFQSETGHTVEIEWQGRDVMTKLAPLLRSGDVPDVVDQAIDKIAPVLGSTGQAADLGSVWDVELDGASLSDAGLGKYRDLSSIDGTAVMVPYQATGISLWYDGAASPELETPPATIDDLGTALREMKERTGTAPIALDGDYPFARLLWIMESLRAHLGSAEAVNELAADQSGEAWDSPEVREAIEWVAQLHADGMFLDDSFGTKWPTQQEAFASGNGQSVMLGGSWFPVEVSNSTAEGVEWATTPMPSGDTTEVPVSLFGLAVPSKSDNVDVAKDFIAFFVSPTYQDQLVADAQVLPVLDDVEAPESLQGITDALKEGEPVIVNAGIDIDYPLWMELIKDNSVGLLTGSDDVDTFIANCKAAQIAYWEQNA